MKILVIDDDDIVAQSCRRILEPEGMTIYISNSVDEGEKMLIAHALEPFDLILTDIKMPKVDGFEMIQRTKKVQPGTPILMMTGYLTTETNEKGRLCGADHYIEKPFTPDELIEAVEATIKLK